MTQDSGQPPRILVVDDDEDLAATCARLFERRGYRAEVSFSAPAALERLQSGERFEILLTDVRMPSLDGLDLLIRCREQNPDIDVVLMTGYGTIQSAVQAMKLGAADYLTKPLDLEKLTGVVSRLTEARRLRRRSTPSGAGGTGALEEFVAVSPATRALVSRALSAARSESTVLILGESGTGKELIARAIHAASPRAQGPFLAVNCAALPDSLVESLLFGHRRGAFTGADSAREGLVRAAGGGTLFLDEVVEMPLGIQSKVLRCLEFHTVRPVGEVQEVAVDVRIIAATNRDVKAMLASGALRRDLFYRLSVVTLEIPPLRERLEEIPALLEVLALRLGGGSEITGVDPGALEILTRHSWPGNVRELANLVEGLVATGFTGRISAADLPDHVRSSRSDPGAPGSPPQERGHALEDAEREAIVRALAQSGGNKSRAAEILGISRSSLYAKLKLFNLLS